MDDVNKWRKKVEESNAVKDFESNPVGQLIIKWLNTEIYRLTNELVNNDELDTDNAKRSAVRGELKAYQLIGKKLALSKLEGKSARATLEANGVDVEDEVDQRTPEEIAQDAGL